MKRRNQVKFRKSLSFSAGKGEHLTTEIKSDSAFIFIRAQWLIASIACLLAWRYSRMEVSKLVFFMR